MRGGVDETVSGVGKKIYMRKKSNLFIIILSAVILFVFIFVIPLVINELYKTGKGYKTTWNGADVLSYYGSVLSSVGGILGVFFSIRYAQKEYKEDSRQRILPFVATESLMEQDEFEKFCKNENNTNDKNYYVITCLPEKGIEYPKAIPKNIEDIIRNRGNYTEEIVPGCYATMHKEFLFVALKLKNIGEGAACNLTFGLYKLKDGKYQQEIELRKKSIPFLLDRSDILYVGIYWDLENSNMLGTYNFDIMYSDINYTRYRRSISYEIIKNDETSNLCFRQIDTCEHKVFSTKK